MTTIRSTPSRPGRNTVSWYTVTTVVGVLIVACALMVIVPVLHALFLGYIALHTVYSILVLCIHHWMACMVLIATMIIAATIACAWPMYRKA